MAGSLVQQKFGAAAADYAASTVHAKGESLARLVALVAPQRHWRALDVATGAGHTALALAPHVEHVVASDITGEMLAEAGKLAAQRGLANVETAHADAAALPFPDESFDLVTCRLAAHHFPDPAAFVAESWRVLKPGGVFALVDNISPDADILPGASREEADRTAADYNAYEKLRDPSHGRCLSLAEWSALLTRTALPTSAPSAWIRTSRLSRGRSACAATPPPSSSSRAMLAEPRLDVFLRPRTTERRPHVHAAGGDRRRQEAGPTAMKPAQWESATAPTLADFEVLAAEAWKRLPEEFRAKASDVLIRVEDFATDEVLDSLGIESPFDLLGLYHGVSLDHKSVMDLPLQPDMVFLYRRAILEEWAEGEETLGRLVAHILVHEIGHHFGFSDDDMERIEAAAGT